MESLKVSLEDKRRTFFNTYWSCLHSHNFESMREFFCENAVDQFVYKYDSTGGLANVIIPQKVEIRGIDNFIEYMSQVIKSFPDIIYIVKDTIIRNRKHSSCITCNWNVKATPVYELKMKASISDLGEVISFKDSNKNINGTAVSADEMMINLTELSDKVAKLNISMSNSSNASDKIQFETGNIIPHRIKTYSGRGTSSFHMNRDEKIYLFEHFSTRDETDLATDFDISLKRKLSNYIE